MVRGGSAHRPARANEVPEVLREVETGHEPRWNLPHRLRPAWIDWDGDRLTAETVERAEWQVAGIARTLVDAIEGARWTPRPSPGWLERYADVLDVVRDAHLDDPAARPTYGALVLDAERLAHDLRDRHPSASVPTDSGPLRVPLADALPPTIRPTVPPNP